MIQHIDYEWVQNKIGGHGGAYSCNGKNGLMVIRYIGSTSRIKVLNYNIILFFKYLKRIASRK